MAGLVRRALADDAASIRLIRHTRMTQGFTRRTVVREGLVPAHMFSVLPTAPPIRHVVIAGGANLLARRPFTSGATVMPVERARSPYATYHRGELRWAWRP